MKLDNKYFYLPILIISLTFFAIQQFRTLNTFDWDGLAYSWIALSMDSDDSEYLHKTTYQLLKNHTTEARYKQLTGELGGIDAEYRKIMAMDYKLFEEQISFYQIKPVLPTGMWLLSKTGMSPFDGARLLNSVSYFCIGLMLFLCLSKTLHPGISLISTYIIMQMTNIYNLGSLITPDSISACMLILAFYVYWVLEKYRLALIIVMFSIFVRPDNAILCGVIIISAFLLKEMTLKQSVASMLGLCFLYFLLYYQADYYGWSVHFYVTFVDRVPDIASFVSPLTFSDYLELYPRILSNAFFASSYGGFTLLGLWLLVSKIDAGKTTNMYLQRSMLLMFAIFTSLIVYSFISSSEDLYLKLWFAFILLVLLFSFLLFIGLYFKQDIISLNKENPATRLLPAVIVYMLIHFLLFPIAKYRMLMAAYMVISFIFTIDIIAKIRKDFGRNKKN